MRQSVCSPLLERFAMTGHVITLTPGALQRRRARHPRPVPPDVRPPSEHREGHIRAAGCPDEAGA
jgi:hypothetical protein